MTPAIAILLPAFHAEATLPRAVESLLAQSWRDWVAIIAADDGRDYLTLLAKQGMQDPRLQQVSTGRHGSGDHGARNAALAAAGNAPYLATLDADDAFAPERLAQLLPLAERHGAAVCNTLTHDEDGRAYKRAFPQAQSAFAMDAAAILAPRSPFFPLFRRDLAGEGWPVLPFCSDVLFNLELLSRAERGGGALMCNPEPLYRYYKTPGSITNAANTPAVADAGYATILKRLRGGHFDLPPDVRAAAKKEFAENRRVNAIFARWLSEGRCRGLEDFLDRTENGRASWLREACPA